jgi:hypothetical protein
MRCFSNSVGHHGAVEKVGSYRTGKFTDLAMKQTA